jgi:3-methyladenine DNA glycosylase AlkC
MADLLKDVYNKKFILELSSEIMKVYPTFNEKKFTRNIFNKEWGEKELKQRMRHISENMQQSLPNNYIKALAILKPVSLKFTGLGHLIFPDFIEFCGLDDYESSVSAMAFFTEGSSSEFPIRFFIIKYRNKMIAQMKRWAKSDNEHLRRLASEGCRPRLPWAVGLPDFKRDPGQILPILEQLKTDESEYVRRSVANNLNDISKDHPDVVIKIAKKWKGLNPATDKLVKHACRTLLKAGNVDTLKLFGYKEPKDIFLEKFKVSKEIKMGDEIMFSFSLVTVKNNLGRLRIEYIINYVRQNNKTGRKVFKISEGDFSESAREMSKKHSFRKISTRKYYPGKHGISIVVNGKVLAEKSFLIRT